MTHQAGGGQDASSVAQFVGQLRAAGCVFAEEEAEAIVSRFPALDDQFTAVERRCSGTPLELVLGVADFAGTTVTVAPGVFLPRHRAEALVTAADLLADSLPSVGPARTGSCLVLDLGCGTGAIASAVCCRHPHWEVHACDLDPAAVRCARVNARAYGFAVHRADWFDGLPQPLRGRLSLIIAHLPYVPTAELALLPRDYRAVEPASAVDGGRDGLDPWRAVAARCPDWLLPGGHLLTQVALHQADAASAVAAAVGLPSRLIEYDDSVVVDVQAGARGYED